jgi:NACHT/LRR/PYD domain-containing protein 3
MHLNLSQTLLNPDSFRKLFKAMMRNYSVTSLEVGNPGNINRNRLGTKGTLQLAEMLKANHTLQFLDFRGLTMGDMCCSLLAQGLQENTSLVYLNLSRCDLSSESMSELAKSLRCSSLLDLDLSNNNLGDSGVARFCVYIASVSCKLKKLDLTNCKIGPAGANCIFSKIYLRQSHCPGLQNLILAHNRFYQRSVAKIGQCV